MAYELDDVWVDKFNNTNLSLKEKRRLYRVLVVFIIGLFYLFDSILLYLFYLAGTIEIKVFYIFSSLTLLHVILFSTIHWLGISEKSKNPHLTIWQLIFGSIIILITMNFATRILTYFLALIFIVFSFATIRISFKESLFVWLFITILVAMDFYFLNIHNVGIPNPTNFEKLLILIAFSSVLLRIILIGFYNNYIRLKLFEMNNKLENDNKVDSLTQVYNKKAILEYLQDFINVLKRKKQPFCVVMIDLDYFKKINDKFGHQIGDIVLQKISQYIKENIRSIDKFGRYGGEEFLLIIESNSLDEVCLLIERIRFGISLLKFEELNNQSITISCGLYFVKEIIENDNPVKKADLALYEAKSSGRNKLICYNYIN